MSEFKACASAEVADGSALKVEVGGETLAVVRVGGDLFAIEDRCTHAEASLSEGEIWSDEREIECPRHGSTFSLETGDALTLPATVRATTYLVTERDGDVFIDLPSGTVE